MYFFLSGKYVVLFFYPLDFTFVCPTEIIAFNDRVAEFKKINTEVSCYEISSEPRNHLFQEYSLSLEIVKEFPFIYYFQNHYQPYSGVGLFWTIFMIFLFSA